MINDKQIKEVHLLLSKCERPVIFFDDDPDGLCSFALLYRYLKKGSGVIVKNSPEVTFEIYAKKAEEYSPDLIIILDKPRVSEDFIDNFDCPILWIDHHELQDISSKHVHYYNPLQNSDVPSPTTYQVWKIVESSQKDQDYNDLWLAIVGISGDWFIPDGEMIEIARKKWSNLIPTTFEIAPDLMFFKNSGIGKIIKTIRFNLKGSMKHVQKSFKIMTRLESPDEIILQTTAQGKFLHTYYRKLNEYYVKLLKEATSLREESLFLVAIMHQDKYSFSSELSNEIFYKNPDKIVVVGRSSSGYTKGSLRTSFDINLNEIVQEAVLGLDGYSGGHPKACGFKINDSDFELFLDRFKQLCLERLNKD